MANKTAHDSTIFFFFPCFLFVCVVVVAVAYHYYYYYYYSRLLNNPLLLIQPRSQGFFPKKMGGRHRSVDSFFLIGWLNCYN